MADQDIHVPRELAELANASTPESTKNIRACKRCGLLKTLNQFLDGKFHLSFGHEKRWLEDGCDNCPFLEMRDDPARAIEYTSAFFEGTAAIMTPNESWAARWMRIDRFVPGVYALSVTGEFDKEMEEDLEHRGLKYRCRPP